MDDYSCGHWFASASGSSVVRLGMIQMSVLNRIRLDIQYTRNISGLRFSAKVN